MDTFSIAAPSKDEDDCSSVPLLLEDKSMKACLSVGKKKKIKPRLSVSNTYCKEFASSITKYTDSMVPFSTMHPNLVKFLI